jgi:outer membrane protein
MNRASVFAFVVALGTAAAGSSQTPSQLHPPAAAGSPTAPAAPVPPSVPAPQPPAARSSPQPPASQSIAPPPAPQPGASPAANLRSQSAEGVVTPARDASSFEVEGLSVQQGGLTAEDTVRRALAVSASVQEKQAEIDAANARIRQTTIQFVPKLKVEASYMRMSKIDSELGGAIVGAQNAGPLRIEPCDEGSCVVDSEGAPVGASSFSFPMPEDNFALKANLAIPLSDYLFRLSDASSGARASKEAARHARTAAESKVRTDARVLYYNWLRAHAQSFIAAKAVERTHARLEDARASYSVGKVANADIMRIEALVANSEASLQQAEAFRALIGAQLAIIMRDPKGGEYTVGSTLPILDAEELAPDGVRRLTHEALARRLELRAIDAAAKALEYGKDAVVAGGYPRLDAVGEVLYANPNQRFFPPENAWNGSWAVGVVASWSADAPFAGSAQAAELAAQGAAVRAQRANLESAIVNEVVSAQLDLVKAKSSLKAGETSVRAFDEAYRVATDLFRVGRGTTSDLIDAETDLLGAKLAIVNARIDLTIAVTRLEYALGREASTYKPR